MKNDIIASLADAIAGTSWLPAPGHRFTYTHNGTEKVGTVVGCEMDRLLPWEVLVHVRFDDGEETTFWNSSFVDHEALGRGEKIVHHA